MPASVFDSTILFQSALPRGERRYRNGKKYRADSGISIRAPARGATVHLISKTANLRISIRAPARGATIQFVTPSQEWIISIRAPARGATMTSFIPFGTARDFNPRSREGSDGGTCQHEAVI